MRHDAWSRPWVEQHLRWLVTRQLLQPGQPFSPGLLQPHLLLGPKSRWLYRLGLVLLGGLLLGSFFGLLYGPHFASMLMAAITLPSYSISQPSKAQ